MQVSASNPLLQTRITGGAVKKSSVNSTLDAVAVLSSMCRHAAAQDCLYSPQLKMLAPGDVLSGRFYAPVH
jgi:hypothetical protein